MLKAVEIRAAAQVARKNGEWWLSNGWIIKAARAYTPGRRFPVSSYNYSVLDKNGGHVTSAGCVSTLVQAVMVNEALVDMGAK